jgi:hypothetical protein
VSLGEQYLDVSRTRVGGVAHLDRTLKLSKFCYFFDASAGAMTVYISLVGFGVSLFYMFSVFLSFLPVSELTTLGRMAQSRGSADVRNELSFCFTFSVVDVSCFVVLSLDVLARVRVLGWAYFVHFW